MKKAIAVLCCLLTAPSLFGAANDVISINFSISLNDANSVDADETAVAGTDSIDPAITNALNFSGSLWNNILLNNSGNTAPASFTAATQGGNSIALIDSTGGTVATMTSSGSFYCNFSDSTDIAGNRTAQGEAGLCQSFLNLNNSETVSISGLSSWAPNGYRVVAFFEIGAVNRTMGLTMSDGAESQTIWCQSFTSSDGDLDEDGLVDWIRATGTGSGSATTNGNFGVYQTVFAGDTLSIIGGQASPRSVVSGLQIIALGTDYPAVEAVPVTDGLELWLDATDVDGDGRREGLQETGLLSQYGTPTYLRTWTDKSGHTNAVFQNNRAPVFIQGGGANGMDLSRWEANDRMFVDSMSLGTNITIISVFRANSKTLDQQIFNSNGSGNGGANYILEVENNHVVGRIYDGTDRGRTVDSSTINTNAPQMALYRVSKEPSEVNELFVDGSLTALGTGSTTNPAVFAAACIGAHPDNADYLDGDLYELLVYDRALSPLEIYQVGAYLNGKYSLALDYDTSDIVSVNFYRTGNTAATYLEKEEEAGLVSAPEWLNIDVANSRSFPETMLQNTNGVALPLTIVSTVAPGYNALNNVGTDTPNHKMMNTALYYDNTDNDTGAITISGFGENGMPERYKVIIYFETNANDREHTITIDGVTLYGLDGATFDGTFIRATAIDVNANYMVFDKLTAASFSIDTLSNGRCGIAGIQIIARPYPSGGTLLLLQ